VGEQTEVRERVRLPPLLMTKLHPPARREQTVARDRLVDRLRARAGIRLTVVAAPAGCGKTTLLGDWRELEETAKPVAWLSLDEGDNDPVVLWSYVLAALRRVCPSLQVSSSPELLGQARMLEVFLPELINELTAVGDAALVMDDFHRLTSGPARDSVAWFVEHVPSTFQLILATRNEPALPLGALRAHGALVEVRAADLGFTPIEAAVLLNDRLELGLELADIENLVERTEGWAAGIYLAALTLQMAADRSAAVSRFGGENRHVVDFLVDEVLEAHDQATQELMLRSSVLDRLCGPLCDALLDQEGAAKLLDALARANLFLLPLDDAGEWYRFHHLFAQLLRVELEHREPGLAPELHRRAFAWHRDNGSPDAAIEHALEGRAFAEAAELVAAAWIDYVHLGRHTTVLAWLERFPREVVHADPQLLLVQAWVLSLSARRGAAADAIAALERLGRPDAGPLLDGFSSVEASLATLRATIPWGDFGAGLENGRRASELEGPTSPWRPLVSCSLGGCLYFSGEFDEAERWLAEATGPALAREQWRVAVSALATRSLVVGELRRVDEQAELAEQALEVAREHGLEDVEGEVFIALGASRAAHGRPDEALAAFERAVVITRAGGHPRGLADALIRQAAVLQSTARKEATAVIEEARATVDLCPDPRLLAERLAALERPPRTRRRYAEAPLSARELVILRMLTSRLSERDIGRELYLSHNTIHSHTRSIYRKLGASSRGEALEKAATLGIL
jgi:LuxR family transcriptional regulator, maltose regulon positive regulatory protein